MSTDVFTIVADPTRRRILRELLVTERSVGELVGSLGLSQPTVSKHLRVLREGGFVASRIAAQQRFYHLEPRPLTSIDAWLEPFRQLWNRHLDALERHLDTMENPENPENLEEADGRQQLSAQPARAGAADVRGGPVDADLHPAAEPPGEQGLGGDH